MNDVWKELEEKLKQKAKSTDIIYYKHMKGEFHAHIKWVMFEDVRKELQQLKQKYVLISKDWLKSYCDRCGQKKFAAEVWRQTFNEEPPEEALNCPDCGIDHFIEELLRKNEG